MSTKNMAGFPQIKRHLSALTRMPATHVTNRPLHVSDIVYSLLRNPAVSQSMLRRGGSGPTGDKITSDKAGKLKSNSMWKSVLKKSY